MRGLLLAGGNGTRLAPNTLAVNKHLLPVFDKPLVYYSLSTLMLASVRDVRVILRRVDDWLFESLLGDGSQFGLNISYGYQDSPLGIPDAIQISREFIDDAPFTMALGDNVFFGSGLTGGLQAMVSHSDVASIFLKSVPDPERFGVAWVSETGEVKHLQEKPLQTSSNLAVTGLYHLPSGTCALVDQLTPSNRNELEITDLLKVFLEARRLRASVLPRGTMWLDTGTTEAMMDASNFVRSFQDLSGDLIGSPHEIAWRNGWVSSESLEQSAKGFKNRYGDALLKLLAPRG